MSGERVNILDPKVWNQLPESNRISSIVNVQELLIVMALKSSGYGDELIRLKTKGDTRKIASRVFVVSHREEKIVPSAIRKEMSERNNKYWMFTIPVTSRNTPKGASKQFVDLFKKTRRAKPDGDFFCMIVSGGMSFLVSASIDQYVQYLKDEHEAEVAKQALIEKQKSANDATVAPANDQTTT